MSRVFLLHSVAVAGNINARGSRNLTRGSRRRILPIDKGGMHMKPLAPIALLWLIVFTCAAPAEARGGCGRGSHRGYYGRCNENMAHAHRAARYHRHDSDPTM